jgi:ketosteroid isomerase-like protein
MSTSFTKEIKMSEKNAAIAEAYYTACGAKNIADMGKYLHPNVQFLAPLAELTGKEAVLEAAERLLAFFKSLKIRTTFGSENQAMVVFDLECPAPVGICRSATLMTIENGLITRMELFYDARPFEKK